MVVRLWIAEGLVCQSKSDKTMEEIGDEYFDELVANFKIHDLINGLTTMISYNRGKYDSFNKFDYFYGSKGLSSFIALPLRLWWVRSGHFSSHYLSNTVVYDLSPEMTKLRVLALSHYVNITELPDCQGNSAILRSFTLEFRDCQK